MTKQPGRGKQFLQSKAGLLLVGAVAVLLLAGGVYLFMQRQQANTANQPTGFAGTTQVADELDQSNDYSAQADTYRDFLAQNPDSPDAPDAMLKLATASLNDKDYDTALDYYKRALAADPEYAVASYRGQSIAYEKKAEYQLAIDARQAAIDAVRNDGGNKEEAFLIDQDLGMIERLKQKLEAEQ